MDRKPVAGFRFEPDGNAATQIRLHRMLCKSFERSYPDVMIAIAERANEVIPIPPHPNLNVIRAQMQFRHRALARHERSAVVLRHLKAMRAFCGRARGRFRLSKRW